MRWLVGEGRGMGIAARNVDLLIVGGGLAGLQSAVAAAEVEPSLHIAIADIGGCASTEVMGFCAPLAFGDSIEAFEADMLVSGAGVSDPRLVRRLAEEAIPTVKRLECLGIEFDHNPDGGYALLRSLGSRFPRVVHHGTVTGKEIIAKYLTLLSANPNVEFRLVRILKLFKKNGVVCGALGFEKGKPVCFNAKSIVLAAGGAAGLFGFSTWSKVLRGSGYALAFDIGAKLTGMEHVQFEPCVTVHPEELCGFPIITTLLFEGATLRDGDGADLLDDLAALSSKKALVEIMENAKPCAHGGFLFDFSRVDKASFQRKYPEYWRKLGNHIDEIEVKPAAHTTLGGIAIDVDGASSIHGLFAAGECVGGIHGADRIGGNAGLEVLVFGRIAGHSAATYANHGENRSDVNSLCDGYLNLLNEKRGTSSITDWLPGIGQILDSCFGDIKKNRTLAKLSELADRFQKNMPRDIEQRIVCEHAFSVAALLLNRETVFAPAISNGRHSCQ